MVNKTHTDGMAVMGQEQPAQDEIQKQPNAQRYSVGQSGGQEQREDSAGQQ